MAPAPASASLSSFFSDLWSSLADFFSHLGDAPPSSGPGPTKTITKIVTTTVASTTKTDYWHTPTATVTHTVTETGLPGIPPFTDPEQWGEFALMVLAVCAIGAGVLVALFLIGTVTVAVIGFIVQFACGCGGRRRRRRRYASVYTVSDDFPPQQVSYGTMVPTPAPRLVPTRRPSSPQARRTNPGVDEPPPAYDNSCAFVA